MQDQTQQGGPAGGGPTDIPPPRAGDARQMAYTMLYDSKAELYRMARVRQMTETTLNGQRALLESYERARRGDKIAEFRKMVEGTEKNIRDWTASIDEKKEEIIKILRSIYGTEEMVNIESESIRLDVGRMIVINNIEETKLQIRKLDAEIRLNPHNKNELEINKLRWEQRQLDLEQKLEEIRTQMDNLIVRKMATENRESSPTTRGPKSRRERLSDIIVELIELKFTKSELQKFSSQLEKYAK